MKDKKAGDTIEAGELLLFTGGSYSGYGVSGLYRAKQSFVMPAVTHHLRAQEHAPDIHAVAANPELVEELDYTEVWKDD